MSHVTFGRQIIGSQELALLSGFDRRHIPRKAQMGEIPNAERTRGRHWKFCVTDNLQAWICFYRVRHTLLGKERSPSESKTLKFWGTDWKYARETLDFLKRLPNGST